MLYRKAVLTDIDAVRELSRRELFLSIPGFHWHTARAVREMIEGGHFFVVTDKNRVIAILGMTMERDSGCIEMLAVSHDTQRKGIGREIVDLAREYTRRKGRGELAVLSFSRYKATAFYKKCGFALTGRGKSFGARYNCFTMNV